MVVVGDDVGPEENAVLESGEERHELVARVGAELADHPLGGGRVEDDVGVAFHETGEEGEILGAAAHVGDEPGDLVGLEHLLEAVVLVRAFGAVAVGVGVLGGEPGVGVGDVGHEHHAELDGTVGDLAAPEAVDVGDVVGMAEALGDVDEAGGGPELDAAGAVIAVPSVEVVEEALLEGVLAVGVHVLGDGDELGDVGPEASRTVAAWASWVCV
jgi:hypothetical protein